MRKGLHLSEESPCGQRAGAVSEGSPVLVILTAYERLADARPYGTL